MSGPDTYTETSPNGEGKSVRWQMQNTLSTFHEIQINCQPDATIFHFIILTFIYSSTCFGRCPAHHQELNDCSGSLWFYLRIVVTAVFVVGPVNNRPDHEHSTAGQRPKHVEL
jgi:hypothetical protein